MTFLCILKPKHISNSNKECDNGYYGKNCKHRCGNGCSRSGSNAICDKENGRCLNGCNPGYKGSFCDEGKVIII